MYCRNEAFEILQEEGRPMSSLSELAENYERWAAQDELRQPTQSGSAILSTRQSPDRRRKMKRVLWVLFCIFFFFSSRRRHTRSKRDWSSDVCSSDLRARQGGVAIELGLHQRTAPGSVAGGGGVVVPVLPPVPPPVMPEPPVLPGGVPFGGRVPGVGVPPPVGIPEGEPPGLPGVPDWSPIEPVQPESKAKRPANLQER